MNDKKLSLFMLITPLFFFIFISLAFIFCNVSYWFMNFWDNGGSQLKLVLDGLCTLVLKLLLRTCREQVLVPSWGLPLVPTHLFFMVRPDKESSRMLLSLVWQSLVCTSTEESVLTLGRNLWLTEQLSIPILHLRMYFTCNWIWHVHTSKSQLGMSTSCVKYSVWNIWNVSTQSEFEPSQGLSNY